MSDGKLVCLYEVNETIKKILDRLSGDEGKQWSAILEQILQGKNPWSKSAEYETWNTIYVGAYATLSSLVTALLAVAQYPTTVQLEELTETSIDLDTRSREIHLVEVNAGTLSSDVKVNRKALYSLAMAQDLRLCGIADSIYVLMEPWNIREGLYFFASDPILCGHKKMLLYIEVGSNYRYLKTLVVDEDFIWPLDTKWIFRRPELLVI